MRIAEILLRPTIGGAETLVNSLSSEWRSLGHDVQIIYVDPPGSESDPLRRVMRLRHSLRMFRPNVVHSHSAIPNVYARLASRGTWPVVTVLHSASRDFDDPKLRFAERLLQRWTHAVIAVSKGLESEYRTRISKHMRISTIRNGVRSDIRERTGGARAERVAVAAGRVVEQKRPDLLIEAWQNAAPQGWRLQIAGSSSNARYLNEVMALAARSTNAGAPVELLGEIEDMPSLLEKADLFVHAATREAQGLAPLEAAAAGIPVIVADAVAEAIGCEALPMVCFVSGNVADLADVLVRVTRSYEDFAEYARLAMSTVRTQFSISRCAADHLAVLESGLEPATVRAGHAQQQ
jgi:glycosyltransferase involved in cell wall biosynthesis